MHVAGQPRADLAARIGQAGAVVEREVHRLRVDHLARGAVIGQVAGDQRAPISASPTPCLDLHLTQQAVGSRPRTAEAGDDVVDADLGHFLRGLDDGADRALRLLHRRDLATAHAA